VILTFRLRRPTGTDRPDVVMARAQARLPRL
jgi:hypothetical protein